MLITAVIGQLLVITSTLATMAEVSLIFMERPSHLFTVKVPAHMNIKLMPHILCQLLQLMWRFLQGRPELCLL